MVGGLLYVAGAVICLLNLVMTWANRTQGEPEVFEAFLADYRVELARQLPDTQPFYYPFTWLLFHAVRA